MFAEVTDARRGDAGRGHGLHRKDRHTTRVVKSSERALTN